jgi:hypothetical protein
MLNAVGTRAESSIDPVGVTTYTLPSNLKGDYSAINHSSMWVDGDEMVVIWVGPNREIRLARRLWRRPFEASINLSTVTGSVFTSQWTLDSHNYMVVAKCSAGYYHVAGDMHAVPLKYMRSSSMGSLSDWNSTMIGTEETSCTYPQFIKAKSGTLYFWYRYGSSGDGDWYLNKWDASTLTWSRVGRVHYGTADNVNAYPHEIAVDPVSGRWHMLWTIRKDFSSIDENENIYGAYSDDEGVTWRKYSDDSAYTLPITWASGEIIQSIPGGAVDGRALFNGGQTSVGPDGLPQSVWLYESASGSNVYQYRHLWLDGSKVWHWDTLLSGGNSSARMPGLALWPDGRRWMFFQNGAGGRGNTLRYVDIDTGIETVVLNQNMLNYIPTVCHSKDRGVIYMIAPYERQDGLTGGEPADITDQPNVPVLAIR